MENEKVEEKITEKKEEEVEVFKKDNKKDIDKIIDQIGQVRRIAWQMGINPYELELAKFIRKKEMGIKGMDSIINDCRRKLNGKTNS